MPAQYLKVVAVGVIEGGKLVAVDVEHTMHFAVSDEGYYNL